MGKKNGGHRKTKTGAAELVADIVLVVDGGRRILTADYTTLQWHLSHGTPLMDFLKEPTWKAKAVPVVVGAVEIIAGPRAVKIAKKALPAPIKRAKMPGSQRKWV